MKWPCELVLVNRRVDGAFEVLDLVRDRILHHTPVLTSIVRHLSEWRSSPHLNYVKSENLIIIFPKAP